MSEALPHVGRSPLRRRGANQTVDMSADPEDLRGGPIPVASVWLTAILDNGDLGEAWPWTAPALRRAYARIWLWSFAVLAVTFGVFMLARAT